MVMNEESHSAREPSGNGGRGSKKHNRKRTTVALTCGALALGLLTGGILAYQTDKDAAGNIFEIGRVSITASEPKFPTVDEDKGTGKPGKDGVPDDCELLIPFEEVTKDPRIANTGPNDVVVFFRMTSPVEELTLLNDDGTRTGPADADLFWYKQEGDSPDLHENHFNSDWIEITDIDGDIVECEGINNDNKGKVYIFGYHVRISEQESTSTLFDKIQNKKYGSRTIEGNEVENVKLESFAIQADDILRNGERVNTSGEISPEDLTYIYRTYIHQNKDAVGDYLVESGVL